MYSQPWFVYDSIFFAKAEPDLTKTPRTAATCELSLLIVGREHGYRHHCLTIALVETIPQDVHGFTEGCPDTCCS